MVFNRQLADKILKTARDRFPEAIANFGHLQELMGMIGKPYDDEWRLALDALEAEGSIRFQTPIRTGNDKYLRDFVNMSAPITRLSTEPSPPTHSGLLIFISHSSKDKVLGLALIDLLTAGLALTADKIRCSSVDGYRLPVGVNTEGKLREEVNASKIVIGLITPSSLSSYYVMFELGARWGANLFLAPLLAGVETNELSGPLSLLNALSANNEAQIHQLIQDIAAQLRLPLQPAASYIRHVKAVKALADAVEGALNAKPVAATIAPQKLRMTISAEGHPPAQILKLVANQPVTVSRIDYMLSTEVSLAGQDVSLQGETVDIPINDSLLLKVWNTPRADRNNHDHSGPAKIGITVSANDHTDQYIMPIQMENVFQDSTLYRRVVGSKTFFQRV